jgi:plastocyanin
VLDPGERRPVGAGNGEIVHRKAGTGRRWTAGCALIVSLLTVTACSSAASNPAAQTTTAGSSGSPGKGPGQTGSADGDTADCTRATKVTIVQKPSGAGDTYSFSPKKLTIQRGAFLAITNKSDRVHELVSTPGAGIVTSVLDLKERQVIQFPKAGTFTVKGAGGARRAVLKLTVSGESGCGTPKPTLTITDTNTFSPAKRKLTATQNFAVVNDSGSTQTVKCTPDPGGNGDNSRLDKGETQLLAIDKPGRYTCASVQHPGAKVTLTVTGT